MSSREFEEIAHTGGKIEFLWEDGGISVSFTHANPWASTIVQLCVSFEGRLLDFVPASGIGPMPPYPQPSILAYLLSDREGLFGQSCPNCSSYFRSSFIAGEPSCPYCGIQNSGLRYLTANQLQFLTKYCESFIEAMNKQETVALDLDELLRDMSGNRQSWLLPEERQQSTHKCGCRCRFDILGDYGICPMCRKPNFSSVISKKFDEFESQFQEVDSTVTDRHDREIEWEKLTRCLGEYEALGNALKIHLANFPSTPSRREQVSELNFQSAISTSKKLRDWFDISMFQDFADDDITFFHKMLQKRHIFTHNAGKVDQAYLDNTGDSTVRLNQVIRFRSREIKRLIPLARKCCLNVIEQYESIEEPQTSENAA